MSPLVNPRLNSFADVYATIGQFAVGLWGAALIRGRELIKRKPNRSDCLGFASDGDMVWPQTGRNVTTAKGPRKRLTMGGGRAR